MLLRFIHHIESKATVGRTYFMVRVRGAWGVTGDTAPTALPVYGFNFTAHCGERSKRFYLVAISRNRAFTVPMPESPIRRYRVDAARNGPVTDRRASYTRRFRAVRVRHVGEGHEELRSNTILKTNSTFNNNSWRGRGAQLAASRVEKSSMRLPSAGARTERRGNHPADFLFALALCSVQFLKLPQD